MTDYKQELAERAMSELPADAPDDKIAATIADYLITRGPAPFVLSINHDHTATPLPKGMQFDSLRRTPSPHALATLRFEVTAREWIRHALLLGYTVTRQPGAEASIANTRERAERAARPRPKDDDVPF